MTSEAEISSTLDFLEVIGGGGREECEAKVHYAMEVEPPNAIVEIGVFRGQGLCCLAYGSSIGHQAPVFGIDLFGLRPSGYGPAYDDPQNAHVSTTFARHLGLDATLMKSESLDAAKDWDAPIGLLTIDAGHKEEDVLKDFQAWSPHLVRGGFLLMHDARNPAWPGIDAVIDAHIRGTGRWEELPFVPPFSAWFRRNPG